MDITQQGYVQTAVSAEGLATITFFHPNHNSLPGKLLADLTAAFEEVGENSTVKVVLLQSAEHKTFCAGAAFQFGSGSWGATAGAGAGAAKNCILRVCLISLIKTGFRL